MKGAAGGIGNEKKTRSGGSEEREWIRKREGARRIAARGSSRRRSSLSLAPSLFIKSEIAREEEGLSSHKGAALFLSLSLTCAALETLKIRRVD